MDWEQICIEIEIIKFLVSIDIKIYDAVKICRNINIEEISLCEAIFRNQLANESSFENIEQVRNKIEIINKSINNLYKIANI